jgi:hypothetical protein
MQLPIKYLYLLLVLGQLTPQTSPRCSYGVNSDLTPFWVDNEPHMVTNLSQCVEYNDKYACCDINNDRGQIRAYSEIDGVFGSKADACDVCAINLKRFWCEYACSPRQS